MYVRKDLQQDEGRKVQKRESTGSWKVLLWKVFLKGPGARLRQKTEEKKRKRKMLNNKGIFQKTSCCSLGWTNLKVKGQHWNYLNLLKKRLNWLNGWKKVEGLKKEMGDESCSYFEFVFNPCKMKSPKDAK